MKSQPDKMAIQFVELSEIQSHLESEEDRQVFSRMVFPRATEAKDLDLSKDRRVRTGKADNKINYYRSAGKPVYVPGKLRASGDWTTLSPLPAG